MEIYYHEIIHPFFLGETVNESQITLMKTINQIWVNNPKKNIQIIEKLYQLGLVIPNIAVKYCIQSIHQKGKDFEIE